MKCLKIMAVATAMVAGAAANAQDTLNVMAYNVLYYGNGCQGPNGLYHRYLKTIVAHTSPDILSLEKLASIPVSPGDVAATAPAGFADSILENALSPAWPGRYAYCPFTNQAYANNQAVLFYDQHKLGFCNIVATYSNLTDFNIYKLYYKDANLDRTHDTTFLYVIPNHDKSGDEYEVVRGKQIKGVMDVIRQHFSHLPNMLDLGDFNVRNSDETFYKLLTASGDTAFTFSDPPFYPDRRLRYPADWDHNPEFAAYFTTSTRESGSIPNSCGSGGGAKNWYDHIFISPWLVSGANYMTYVPGSYRTVGNDGSRFKVSVNNQNTHHNVSVPDDVVEALYRMSNKYPVMVRIAVRANSTGQSLPDPELKNVVAAVQDKIIVESLANDRLVMHFPDAMTGQDIILECVGKDGSVAWSKNVNVQGAEGDFKCKIDAGAYTLRVRTRHNLIAEIAIEKK